MRIQLNKPISFEEIKKITGGVGSCPYAPVFTHITTSSEEALPGDLFVALRGERFDGNDFVPSLLAKGVYAIAERYFENSLLVGNTRMALLSLAAASRRALPSLKYCIGITGSVGKTTTKEFLRRVLSTAYRVHANEGNLNNEIGLSLSILSAPIDTEVFVLEMGMNREGEIETLSRCCMPTHAVITNIGTAHIGNLGSREGIAAAKSEITLGMTGGPVFVPEDEALLASIPHRIGVSTEGMGEISLTPRECLSDGMLLDFSYPERAPLRIATELVGKDALSALAFSLSVGAALGLTDGELRRGIERIRPDALRRRIYTVGGLTVYDDSYNASYEAMLSSLDTFSRYGSAHRAALIGDMLELGRMSEHYHRALGTRLSGENLSEIYLFGVYMPFVRDALKKAGYPDGHIHMNTDLTAPERTAEAIRERSPTGMLLAKASRGVGLERVLSLLSETKKETENA